MTSTALISLSVVYSPASIDVCLCVVRQVWVGSSKAGHDPERECEGTKGGEGKEGGERVCVLHTQAWHK